MIAIILYTFYVYLTISGLLFFFIIIFNCLMGTPKSVDDQIPPFAAFFWPFILYDLYKGIRN